MDLTAFNDFIDWLKDAIENVIAGIEAFIEKVQEFAAGFEKSYAFEAE